MCEVAAESYESVYETNNVDFASAERDDTTDVWSHDYGMAFTVWPLEWLLLFFCQE